MLQQQQVLRELCGDAIRLLRGSLQNKLSWAGDKLKIALVDSGTALALSYIPDEFLACRIDLRSICGMYMLTALDGKISGRQIKNPREITRQFTTIWKCARVSDALYILMEVRGDFFPSLYKLPTNVDTLTLVASNVLGMVGGKDLLAIISNRDSRHAIEIRDAHTFSVIRRRRLHQDTHFADGVDRMAYVNAGARHAVYATLRNEKTRKANVARFDLNTGKVKYMRRMPKTLFFKGNYWAATTIRGRRCLITDSGVVYGVPWGKKVKALDGKIYYAVNGQYVEWDAQATKEWDAQATKGLA